MDRPKSGIDFRLMSLTYMFRDLRLPRMEILQEVGIQPGFQILDFGCGPGSYVAAASRLAGQSGKVYTLDIHPLAVRGIRRMASRKGLSNVETILSDCQTGLPDECMDVVLLYDTYHALSAPEKVLKELHRVLKPGGMLSFSDHHMGEKEILASLTAGGLFQLAHKNLRTYSFSKVKR